MAMFRKPKSHQEKVANSDPETKDLVRAKRHVKNLKDDYDDINRSGGKRSGGRKPRYKDHR